MVKTSRQVIAKPSRDQPGRCVHLSLAHAIGRRNAQGNVQDVNAVHLCDAFGGVGQVNTGLGAGKTDLPRCWVEVQHLHEQPAYLGRPLIWGGGEYAAYSLFDFNCVFPVWIGISSFLSHDYLDYTFVRNQMRV